MKLSRPKLNDYRDDVPIWRVSRAWIIVAFLIVILLAIAGTWLARPLTVTVINADDMPLRSVVVHVTGQSYAIGDLLAGEEITLAVEPVGESHVEIEFVNPVGNRCRLVAGCYFEFGYKGNVSIQLNRKEIVSIRNSANFY